MFQVASKKLGLDCVILGNIGGSKAVSENSVDEISIQKLLKYGAYYLYNETENENFDKEDIESILENRSVVIDHSLNKEDPNESSSRSGVRNLNKATFTVENSSDISLDDKDFWYTLFFIYFLLILFFI